MFYICIIGSVYLGIEVGFSLLTMLSLSTEANMICCGLGMNAIIHKHKHKQQTPDKAPPKFWHDITYEYALPHITILANICVAARWRRISGRRKLPIASMTLASQRLRKNLSLNEPHRFKKQKQSAKGLLLGLKRVVMISLIIRKLAAVLVSKPFRWCTNFDGRNCFLSFLLGASLMLLCLAERHGGDGGDGGGNQQAVAMLCSTQSLLPEWKWQYSMARGQKEVELSNSIAPLPALVLL